MTDNLVDGEVVQPRGVRVRDERRHLPGRRGRQGHGDVLGHRQPRLAGVRLLARRRVRLRRLGGLRPQGARHHRPRRVGVGQAPLPRARGRHAGRRVHRRRHRRHVRRRVRQRDAAVASTSGSSPPTTTGTSSSTRRPGRGDAASPSASGCSSSPGSSWDDYDRELISEGGGVYPRTREVDPRSRRRRARRWASSDEALPPTEVIRAILRAPVDLLWNGGIGTVVKASTETDADAADRSSDAIRVNADELRARVVGEGGNLGFTRRARVEYAARRRAHQRRLHRQLGRRRLLRPRGQPEDPARPGRAARRADPRASATSCSSRSPTTSSRTCSTTRSCRRRSSPRRSSARRRGCSPTRT